MEGRTAGFHVGQIVAVVAGREKGRFLVIVNLDERFLYLADGNKRLVDRAKKKNPCHVRLTIGNGEEYYLPPHTAITDDAVREALRAVEKEG